VAPGAGDCGWGGAAGERLSDVEAAEPYDGKLQEPPRGDFAGPGEVEGLLERFVRLEADHAPQTGRDPRASRAVAAE
jgi:hypothetical protein